MALSRLAKATSGSLVIVAVLSLAAPIALAQGGATGAITGEVLDSTGAVIPGADVKIYDYRMGEAVRSLMTSSGGSFRTTLLPPGSYAVVVSAKGFGTARSEGVEVRVTETTSLSVTLRPAAQSQEVEVTGQIVTVNTENATTGQTIEHEEVSGLPLATRNFQQLLTLSTGASSALNNSEQLGRGTVAINVNGQREDNNNYLIEGISATDYNVGKLTNTPLPSPDVIQEFKVQTSLYDASQGRNGGGMVNAVLRSGTNRWHGDAFEFFRNDVLNANDYFLKRNGQPRPELKQNIFGGSVGGPLGEQWEIWIYLRQLSGDTSTQWRRPRHCGEHVDTSPARRPFQQFTGADFSCGRTRWTDRSGRTQAVECQGRHGEAVLRWPGRISDSFHWRHPGHDSKLYLQQPRPFYR